MSSGGRTRKAVLTLRTMSPNFDDNGLNASIVGIKVKGASWKKKIEKKNNCMLGWVGEGWSNLFTTRGLKHKRPLNLSIM